MLGHLEIRMTNCILKVGKLVLHDAMKTDIRMMIQNTQAQLPQATPDVNNKPAVCHKLVKRKYCGDSLRRNLFECSHGPFKSMTSLFITQMLPEGFLRVKCNIESSLIACSRLTIPNFGRGTRLSACRAEVQIQPVI